MDYDGSMATEDDGLHLRIEVRDGYVFVWQRGLVRSQDELERMQDRIEAALVEAGTRSVMFDNRETLPPDEWLRASMWTWLTEHVRRAALLQSAPRNIKRAERTAKRNRMVVRAFHDEAAAEHWLLGRHDDTATEQS